VTPIACRPGPKKAPPRALDYRRGVETTRRQALTQRPVDGSPTRERIALQQKLRAPIWPDFLLNADAKAVYPVPLQPRSTPVDRLLPDARLRGFLPPSEYPRKFAESALSEVAYCLVQRGRFHGKNRYGCYVAPNRRLLTAPPKKRYSIRRFGRSLNGEGVD
jgi:hypothetical protein